MFKFLTRQLRFATGIFSVKRNSKFFWRNFRIYGGKFIFLTVFGRTSSRTFAVSGSKLKILAAKIKKYITENKRI